MLYYLSGVSGPRTQDPPYYAEVVAFEIKYLDIIILTYFGGVVSCKQHGAYRRAVTMGRRLDVTLTDKERQTLQELVRQEKDVRIVKRAQALLWLRAGERVREVAERLGVTRQTIRNWAKRYQEGERASIREELADKPHPGRPAKKRAVVSALLEETVAQDPRALGYASPVWTTRLLQDYWRHHYGLQVSRRTIRRALRQGGYRYKRARYVLARRSATWRQAKGGSSEG